jgi:hypothetical protein
MENVLMTTDLKTYVQVRQEFWDADDAWQEALKKAFRDRATERRYDSDDSDHPEECRRLGAIRKEKQKAFWDLVAPRQRTFGKR